MTQGNAANGHKKRNIRHTVLLCGSMIVLFNLLGYLLFGVKGLFWTNLFGAAVLISSPQLSPRVILRLYKTRPLSPEQAPVLGRIIRELAGRAGLEPSPQLHYMPSELVNAFSVGHGQEAAIGLTDGLLRQLTIRELIGVLAHEIAHIRNHDLRVMGLADIMSRLTGMLALLGLVLLVFNLPLMFLGRTTVNWYAIVLLLLAPTASALLQLALSRAREFEADLQAIQLTGDPEGLASALEKLEQVHIKGIRLFFPGHKVPDPSLLRSHPVTAGRIARLRALGADGTRLTNGFTETPIPPPLTVVPSLDRPSWHISGLWY